MKTGMIHIYYGDGKGKTTAGMGLSLRAAGHGRKVCICQFMKDNSSGERKIFKQLPNVTLIAGKEKEKFSIQLTEAEKKERREYYETQFRSAVDTAAEKCCDLLFLDEILYTIQAGLFREELLLCYLKDRPEGLELILTGSKPSEALAAKADYISEICKIRHPYDHGSEAREGIEW